MIDRSSFDVHISGGRESGWMIALNGDVVAACSTAAEVAHWIEDRLRSIDADSGSGEREAALSPHEVYDHRGLPSPEGQGWQQLPAGLVRPARTRSFLYRLFRLQ